MELVRILSESGPAPHTLEGYGTVVQPSQWSIQHTRLGDAYRSTREIVRDAINEGRSFLKGLSESRLAHSYRNALTNLRAHFRRHQKVEREHRDSPWLATSKTYGIKTAEKEETATQPTYFPDLFNIDAIARGSTEDYRPTAMIETLDLNWRPWSLDDRLDTLDAYLLRAEQYTGEMKKATQEAVNKAKSHVYGLLAAKAMRRLRRDWSRRVTEDTSLQAFYEQNKKTYATKVAASVDRPELAETILEEMEATRGGSADRND